MAPKRQRDEAGSVAPETKKPRHGFRVGPDNLPDGPWRRKNTKVKKNLIHKAKVKKAYAKIKAKEEQQQPRPIIAAGHDGSDSDEGEDHTSPQEPTAAEQMHPTRHLMLKDEEMAQVNLGELSRSDGEEATETTPAAEAGGASDGHRRRTRRPGYYDKQLKKAGQLREEAAERARTREANQKERRQKLAEREKFKRAMAKTRGADGKKKLGRESSLLLDKVKRLVNEK